MSMKSGSSAYTKDLRLPMMFYTAAVNGVFAFLDRGRAAVHDRHGVTPEFLLNLLFYIIITPVISLTLTRIMYMSENKTGGGGCAGTHRLGAGGGAHARYRLFRSTRRMPLCHVAGCAFQLRRKNRGHQGRFAGDSAGTDGGLS